MPILTTSALSIDYEEHGSPSGPPVVLLHGFPDCKATWRSVIQHLLGLEHPTPRLIVPSLRGYGDTRVLPGQEPTGIRAALGTDVLDLLDALGIERALLVGHDWGARAAYTAAILAPERATAVVSLATAYTFAKGEVPSLEQAHAHWYQYLFQLEAGRDAYARDPQGFGAFLWRTWSPHWQFTPEQLREAQESWTKPDLIPIVLSYYRSRFGNVEPPARYAAAHQLLATRPPVPVPVLLALGGDDHCELPGSSDGLEAFCPAGLEQVEIAGAGHFLPREAPGEVAGLIHRALTRFTP
jgi:pimeloyl-ACP methyl ester carboxylesterase